MNVSKLGSPMLKKTEEGLELHPILKIAATVFPILLGGIVVATQIQSSVAQNSQNITSIEVRTKAIEDALTSLKIEQRAIQVEQSAMTASIRREAESSKEFRSDVKSALSRIERSVRGE